MAVVVLRCICVQYSIFTASFSRSNRRLSCLLRGSTQGLDLRVAIREYWQEWVRRRRGADLVPPLHRNERIALHRVALFGRCMLVADADSTLRHATFR